MSADLAYSSNLTLTLYVVFPATEVSVSTVVFVPFATLTASWARAWISVLLALLFKPVFNWATLTASVSSWPAATPVIWRVTFSAASPTANDCLVAFQAAVSLSAIYPLSLSCLSSATEPSPIATLPSAAANEYFPIAMLFLS